MKRFVPSLHVVVLALIFLNIFGIGVELLLRWKLRSSQAALAPGALLTPPAGIAGSGKLQHEDASAAYACHVIRFGYAECPACGVARSAGYFLLASTLAKRGCDVIVIGARGADFPVQAPGPPTREMVAVDLRFVAASKFNLTPTTVVVDRNWRVLWSTVGAFDEGSAREALARLP